MTNVLAFDGSRLDPAATAHLASVESEQAYLGALLLNNDVLLATAELRTEHFTEEIHRRIFDVASQLIRAGKVATLVTLKTFLGDTDLGGMTIPQYLARLLADAAPPIVASTYAEMITALHERRRLAVIADHAKRAALDPPASATVSDLIDKVEEDLAALRASTPTSAVTRGAAGDFAREVFETAEEMRLGSAPEKVGTSTGFPDVDRDTGGFMGGALWVVAGRPGMGKTVFGTNLVRATATRGVGAIMFSLEVQKRQLGARFLSDLSYRAARPVPFGDIINGRYDDQDAEHIVMAMRRLAEMPLVLDCASRLTVSQIASRVRAERIRMERMGVRLGLIVVDYLKMVHATDRYAGQRHYEVGEISAGLKQIAKDHDLCVVLLAQLNRQTENRQDHRPGLADLRESGDLEADADVVGFVYRDAYYIEQSPDYRHGDAEAISRAIEARHDLEFIIGKNRAGKTRTHQLWVDVGCSKISARDLRGT